MRVQCGVLTARERHVSAAYACKYATCTPLQALFVSAAELVEAWRIFTPLLHQIDEQKPLPVAHPFGALPQGCVACAYMRYARVGCKGQADLYVIRILDY